MVIKSVYGDMGGEQVEYDESLVDLQPLTKKTIAALETVM